LKRAARGSLKIQDAKNRQKFAICAPPRNFVWLYLRNQGTYRQLQKMLNSNISSIGSYNMVDFGPLVAEIGPVVWRTPANFNGFRVLAALLHGTTSGRQRNFAPLNRGRHLYSAGRPSRWALAHILVADTLRDLVTLTFNLLTMSRFELSQLLTFRDSSNLLEPGS